jgi:hypothetical protein
LLDDEWDVMVDLFFYRKVEDIEEQALEAKGDDEGKTAGAKKKWDTYEEEGGEEEQWNA